ncbi:hypothetical protein CEE37_14070 [candidate division LCP-89 bacterium B3_LCP]|uniref:Right handed beta helix domain-containing protein n=1 Tax=candidate division LCP-89 bacterium B3_LCP TaxID=2012998 RepID=A0A532UQM1_UNCL8|nr:MAG: hypothetical protein CEE37_14070 [candidate division LCP-89 bacterium B3_LCP]
MRQMSLMIRAALIVIWVIPTSVYAQPTISGDLSGVIGPGDFIVDGYCYVQEGESLTILPGTRLLFSGHYSFNVYGELHADGTQLDSIYFIRQYPTEECRHGGIRIQRGASQNNTLTYCLVDYAFNPDFPDCWGGGVFCEGGGISMRNSTITNCGALFGGGFCALFATVLLENCHISDCYAIAEGGAFYSAFSSTEIIDCTVIGNTGDHVGGIYIYTNDYAEINGCISASNIATTEAG